MNINTVKIYIFKSYILRDQGWNYEWKYQKQNNIVKKIWKIRNFWKYHKLVTTIQKDTQSKFNFLNIWVYGLEIIIKNLVFRGCGWVNKFLEMFYKFFLSMYKWFRMVSSVFFIPNLRYLWKLLSFNGKFEKQYKICVKIEFLLKN